MTDPSIDDNIERFLDFIFERENIRRRRAKGKPWPWTKNPILREWSFTNIHREHDRVTRSIAKHWREPHADDPNLFLAMVIARFVNQPSTLAQIGYPTPWDERRERFLTVMARAKARGEKVYRSDAYMIHADNSGKYSDVPTYQATEVFDPLWKARARARPRAGDTLHSYFDRLKQFHGMGGGFMPAQFIADLKYVEPLKSAPDWWSFAASGPGSRRGLNRILDRPVDSKWDEGEWHEALELLRVATRDDLKELDIRLCAQDLQNCLCEWDKFERVRLGEGKPKRRYRAPAETLFDEAI
jgi:5-hmdU DNA kinase, helical domain